MLIACACTNLDISWIYLHTHTHKTKSLKMFVRCCKHVTYSLKIFQGTFFFCGHLRNPNNLLLAPWRFFNLLWHLSGLCLKWGWRDSEMVSAYSQPEWNVTANTQTFAFDLHKGTAGVFSREQPHWIHNELLQHSFNSSLNFTPPQPRISCVALMNVEKHISQFPKGQIENMRNSEGGYLWGPDCCLQSEEDKGQVAWATEVFVGKQAWSERQQRQQTPLTTIVSSTGGSETGASVDRRLRNEIKHVSQSPAHALADEFSWL